MSDRSAVVTTFNGKVIDWKLFEDQQQAYAHYNEGVGHLREMMLQRSTEEGDWEIMLVDVKQYALSKPQNDRKSEATEEEVDWYTRYLTAMVGQARKIRSLPRQWSLDMWMKLKDGVKHTLPQMEEEHRQIARPKCLPKRRSGGAQARER